jgi:hypothetical protein
MGWVLPEHCGGLGSWLRRLGRDPGESGAGGGWFCLFQTVGEGLVKIFCSQSRFLSATRD